MTAFGPVIDGDLVTGPPWAAMREGAGREVDLICGFTHEEYRGIAPGFDPSGVDLDAVAEAVGLGADAAAAYRTAHQGRTDAELFVVMMSDALVRMPTTRVAEAHARAPPSRPRAIPAGRDSSRSAAGPGSGTSRPTTRTTRWPTPTASGSGEAEARPPSGQHRADDDDEQQQAQHGRQKPETRTVHAVQPNPAHRVRAPNVRVTRTSPTTPDGCGRDGPNRPTNSTPRTTTAPPPAAAGPWGAWRGRS